MDLSELNIHNSYRHPWEMIRAEFIVRSIKASKVKRLIDIGSGDGYLGFLIERECGIPVIYIDSNFNDVDLAKPNHYLSLENVSACSGDALLLADVLEHIEKPIEFLKMIADKFEKKTKVFLTVPAHQYLFSHHDKQLNHYRRYSRELLIKHTQKSLDLIKCHYLFILPYLVRFYEINFKSNSNQFHVANWAYSENHFFTLMAKMILKIDLFLFKSINGLSLYYEGTLK